MLNMDRIRIDGGTQSRVQLNQDTVDEYAEAYKADASFPAVTVFFDGTDYWLADGFHRYFGAKKAGLDTIYEEVIPGTQRHAVLYSLKANATHGLKRTNADKRKAVKMLLNDAEWSTWSDNKMAQAAGVSHTFVAERRKAILQPLQDVQTIRTVERNGKTYTQDTSKIGKRESVQALNAAQTCSDARVNMITPESAATPFEPPCEGDEELDSLEELKAASAEITKLQKLLETDDKAAEVLRLHEVGEVLQRRNDEHLATIAARDKHIAFLTRQLNRCGKAVGELERDKIAPAVEAMARMAKGEK
jgi:hypothetical protein